jgi:hypothetical protein
MTDTREQREQIEDLKSRFEWLKQERARHEGDWKEVQRLAAPSVYNWGNPLDKLPERPRRFTTRPTHYLKTLVSGITGYSVSPNIVWMKLGLEDAAMVDRYGVKDWLEQTERVLYGEFKRSSLYQQIPRFVEYAATYGHAVMLIDEYRPDGRARFMTVKIPEAYLDANEYDEVDTVFRHFSMTLRNLASFFGEENVSDARREDLKDKAKWNTEVTVLHAVYPRQEFDGEALGARGKPWASVFLDEAQDRVLEEGGYDEFPYAVFIWDRIVGTAYGESPAVQALPDMVLLNKIDKSRIEIAQMAADPPYNVPDSMRGHENVVPHGYNYYTAAGEVVSPVAVGANYPISLEINTAIENRVKDWFHVDFFLMLQHEGGKKMTATEVMELQGEKAAVLSDLVVALNGALGQIIRRTFNILYRRRMIPPPPEALKGSGTKLKVDFTGPLAQAQKKYHEAGGIAQGLQLAGAVAQIAPAALDVINFDRLLKTGLEGAGVAQAIINEDEDVAEIRRARAEAQARAQAQQQAMEQQKNILGNFGKLNEPVKPGSAIEEMGKQMGGGR